MTWAPAFRSAFLATGLVSETWHKSWGGPLAMRTSWNAGRTNHYTSGPGYYTAKVVPSAYAVLWTGAICTSGYPADANYTD